MTLPDPLVFFEGTKVKSAEDWWKYRRNEIVRLFETHVYGKTPGKPHDMFFEITSLDSAALDGKAIKKEVTVFFAGKDSKYKMNMIIYIPRDRGEAAPLFLGLNGYGNQSISHDSTICITDDWVLNKKGYGVVDHRATEATRGVRASRWPLEMIIERGYGLATFCAADLDPDYDDGFQ